MRPSGTSIHSLHPFYDVETLHVRSYDSFNNDDRPVVNGDTQFYLDLARRSGGEVLDNVTQVRRDLWRYRSFEKDGTIAEEEALELAPRWTFRWEMRNLLRLAGFDAESEFSDFAGSPPAYGKEQIWVAHPCP